MHARLPRSPWSATSNGAILSTHFSPKAFAKPRSSIFSQASSPKRALGSKPAPNSQVRAIDRKMTSSTKILVGLVSGVLVGIFFGEHASALKLVADGFVKLLQMTVLPYITLSIVTSLGALSFAQVKILGLRAGTVLVGLWFLALVFTFLVPLAFPAVETASFFSAALVERRPPFNFIDLFIPSNPFHALSNNVVPAVVL